MRRSVAACTLLIAASLSACSGGLRAKFPTEEEVRGKLHRGMTAEQVLATFGEPAGHQWVDVNLGGKVHYIAPPWTRSRAGSGYAGFTVYFDRGKVWDWEVILLNPSYEPLLLPQGARSWQVQVIAVLLLTAAGFLAVRLARSYHDARRELLRAYAAREIPTAELPPDFRFLTADASLQTVLDQAGPPSRTIQLPVRQSSGDVPIQVLEYELPNDAALFVMPEQPAAPDSRIRAVVYRRSR